MTTHRSTGRIALTAIFAVVFISGYCGIGRCMLCYDRSEGNLSGRDSLIQEMTYFIRPDVKLSKPEKRHIENRIKGFPHRVLRRDTVSYFLNMAYAVAYYEFVSHDYKKAQQWVDEFGENGMPTGLLSRIFRYSAIGFNASVSLGEKGNIKHKTDKNSWLSPINISFGDSVKYDGKRTPVRFIDSYLDDVPMDCNIATYRKLLTFYKDGGGRLECLNGYSRPGFIQRCLDAGRNDIFKIVGELLGGGMKDFHTGKSGYLEYVNPSVRVDSAAIAKITQEIEIFNPARNRAQIDSLLNIGETSAVGSKVLLLLNQYYNQSRYTKVIDACERYSSFLKSSQYSKLQDYWGLALSALGRHEEALAHYDIALSSSADPATISTIRLNKACTLGEMGRTDEAVAIFMAEKDLQDNPFRRFCWNDNLGYVYSLTNPAAALYYYEKAEEYLDSGTLYEERKVRHFCRKAQVLNHNKYLQRLSIEEAMKFTRGESCSAVAKGMAYTELGVFNMSVFDYKEADRNFETARQLLHELPDADLRKNYLDLNYAGNLCNLSRYEDAAVILTGLLENAERIYGRNSRNYLQPLRQLLQLVCEHPVTGITAEELYENYIRIRDCRFIGNPDYEDVEADIIFANFLNDKEKVKRLCQDALNIPFSSIQRLNLYIAYETACREICTPTDYNAKTTPLIPQIKADIVNSLLALTEEERQALQNPLSEILNGMIAAGSYSNALDLSLFRKGLLFATRKAIESTLAKGRKTKKQYRNLIRLREKLNSAIEYNDTVHIPQFAAAVSALERELAHAFSSDKKVYRHIDKTLQMVTSALGRNSLAVDFVRFNDGEEIRYGAFLIDCGGFRNYVHLGTQQELKEKPNSIWNFLEEGCSEYSDVFFSADGFLNNLAIEYIDFSEGSPVASRFNLHRVFHLSDIKPGAGIGKNIVAVGVSDYNSPAGHGEIPGKGSWTDLLNVNDEIQLISNKLKNLGPLILLNDDASEQAFKNLSGTNVSVLHISTHGFYRSNEMLNRAASDSGSYDYNIARRFLASGISQFSGLVLRAGNFSWRCREILEDNDGLITAEEIEMMNFPNLTLTVLSACSTGLGEIDADGVWGLQRAFRIAGTKVLICSLANVDEYWTAQFMDSFYEQAAKGKTIYESFHTAQQWLRQELPDNPEIWSSFILIE